jgi:formate dehydrogenase subunit delta
MSSYDGKLVTMANQIGKFFAVQRQGDPAADIATHIRKFWDPRMRAAIVAHLEGGGAGLDEPVRKAVGRLKEAAAG